MPTSRTWTGPSPPCPRTRPGSSSISSPSSVPAWTIATPDHPQPQETSMQFGIFSVGDVTTDPTTGRTPTEHERIKAQVEIAIRAEEVGLDVVAFGQHHNPP